MMKKLSHCCRFWEPACKFQTPFLLQSFRKARCPGNTLPPSFLFQYCRDAVGRAEPSIPGCSWPGWTTVPCSSLRDPEATEETALKTPINKSYWLLGELEVCRLVLAGVGGRNASETGQGCGHPGGEVRARQVRGDTSSNGLCGVRPPPRPTAVSPWGWLGAGGCRRWETQPRARDCLFPHPPWLFSSASQAAAMPLPEDFLFPRNEALLCFPAREMLRARGASLRCDSAAGLSQPGLPTAGEIRKKSIPWHARHKQKARAVKQS